MRTATLAAMLFASTAAADISFPDFSSTAGLTMLGNGPFGNGSALRLTSATNDQSAAVWFQTRQSIAAGFTTEFTFQITEPGGVPDWYGFLGADGLAFVIQDESEFSIGNGGSGMCYDAITRSLAVEFDTWGHPFFEDPDSNHVSVQSFGQLGNSYIAAASLALSASIAELSSGAAITARIQYEPGALRLVLDDVEVFVVPVDLESLLGLTDGHAWVGFTSSTGGAWQNHDLLRWTFSEVGGCYPDCEGDGDLDIFDFLCFQGEYANQSSYADCEKDGDWDIFDFLCFQGQFANGCD